MEKLHDKTWTATLKSEKILSDEEAEELHKITRNIRKEKSERKIIRH